MRAATGPKRQTDREGEDQMHASRGRSQETRIDNDRDDDNVRGSSDEDENGDDTEVISDCDAEMDDVGEDWNVVVRLDQGRTCCRWKRRDEREDIASPEVRWFYFNDAADGNPTTRATLPGSRRQCARGTMWSCCRGITWRSCRVRRLAISTGRSVPFFVRGGFFSTRVPFPIVRGDGTTVIATTKSTIQPAAAVAKATATMKAKRMM